MNTFTILQIYTKEISNELLKKVRPEVPTHLGCSPNEKK